MKPTQPAAQTAEEITPDEITDTSGFSLLADETGYDPIEDRLRADVRTTIEAMFEQELAEFRGHIRYGRGAG